MKLQTQIPLEKQSVNLIDYHSNILLLGSCFAENIGEKFEYFKFQNHQNPFGILFHPKAIEILIHNAIHQKKYSEADIFFNNEQWHCYDAHSKLSTSNKEELLRSLNEQLVLTSENLNSSTHVIITFGTAWVYNHFKTNLPVANCHKVPQKEFIKHLLSIEEITNSIKMMVNLIHLVNPTAKIIFTVSPVRHLNDGFVENTQSKAHLISAIHQIVNENCFYFPSFEIMLDELRDYRFYSEDMLHPNKVAIDYIWEKFKLVWMSVGAEETMEKVNDIQKGMQHRPFNPNAEAHQNFLQHLQRKKQQLQSEFPNLKF